MPVEKIEKHSAPPPYFPSARIPSISHRQWNYHRLSNFEALSLANEVQSLLTLAKIIVYL